MTTKEITQRIEDIKASSGDNEEAHGLEDKLREDFILYVSTLTNLSPFLAEKAELVLTTNLIDFERWRA
jgi:hypothetical protein